MAERIKLVLAIPDKPEANPFLETLTKTQFPLEITGKVNRFEDLSRFHDIKDFNFLFLDIDLIPKPHSKNFEQIKSRFKNSSIIIITSPKNYHSASFFLQRGAHGFLDLSVQDPDLLECILIQAQDRFMNHTSMQESQRKLHDLMDNLPGVAYRCRYDAQYTMEFLSAGCKSLTGYDPDDLKNNRKLSFNDLIHPDDRKNVWKTIQEAVGKGNHYQMEYRIHTKTGHEKWVLEQGNAVNHDKDLIMLEGFISDINERHMRENQMGAVIAIADTIQDHLHHDDLGDFILDKSIALFSATGAVIAVFLTYADTLDVQAAGGDWNHLKNENLDISGCISKTSLANNNVVVLNHQKQSSKDCVLLDGSLDQCLAFIPLTTGQKLLGAMVLTRKQEFSDNEKQVFAIIADMIASAMENARLFHRTEDQLHRLESLHTIDQAITGVFDIKVINGLIVQEARTRLNADAAAILHLNRITNTLDCVEAAGFKHSDVKGSKITISTSAAGQVLLDRKSLIKPDLRYDQSKTIFGYFRDQDFLAYFASPLIVKGEPLGVLELFFHTPYHPDEDWQSFFKTLTTQAALAFDSCRTFNDLQKVKYNLASSYQSALSTLTRSLELVEIESPGHAQRVASATLDLALQLGVQKDDLLNIEQGALLHDIGKVGILDEILLKKGSLDEDEWTQIKRHPEIAFDLLSGVKLLRDALDIPYCHHENWDGSGYPRGLKCEEIPLAARIFAVIDSFDSIQSDRPYRKAKTKDEAVNYLIEQKSKRFDPTVVDKFLALLK